MTRCILFFMACYSTPLALLLLIVTLLAATGCASTTIRIPIRLPDGEIVMAEYHSDRDSTIEHMHLEMRPDGTFIAELQGASGIGSTVNAQTWSGLGGIVESAVSGAVAGARP